MKKTLTPQRVPVFISYAHTDNESADPSKRYLDRLLEQLRPLALQDQVCAWSDKELEIGENWHTAIQLSLGNARAAVLLVSPAFMASDYIRNGELPGLLRNAKEKGVVILPVILRPCLFAQTRFKYPDPQHGPEELTLASLQAANSPKEPLNSLSEYEQDKVLLSVAERLLALVHPSAQLTRPAAHGGPKPRRKPRSS
jgi:hypothetical protein